MTRRLRRKRRNKAGQEVCYDRQENPDADVRWLQANAAEKELLRVVRTPENEIRLDRTGKASGRGAYVCPAVECLEKAQKIRALERALEHKVDPEVFERLKEEITKGE